MASETSNTTSSKAPMTDIELLALVKEQLDADAERQAKVSAASAGELPRESQNGSTLDLSHRNVSQLPVEVVELIKDRVERLALSHNQRILLPNEIGQCDRLRYLNLRWNKLVYFPQAVLNLPKLEILDISKNAIIDLPEDIRKMTNLKFLAIAKNRITRLPLALGDMNLVKLKFDENPIDFPPLDALKLPNNTSTSTSENERDKDLCQLVKRYMKTQATNAMREQLRSPSHEDISEANVETPRPLRRAATVGRFPVRPSISGMDYFEPKSESPPDKPPPIPERSHARKHSASGSTQSSKHPGIAPLFTGSSEINWALGEPSPSSASVRSRRQGFVPRKVSNLGPSKDNPPQALSRSSTASTLTPGHSRASSTASMHNGHLGDISSGAPSPVEGAKSRLPVARNLESLPESRNSTLPTGNSLKAVKRVLFMFSYLYHPIDDLTKQLIAGTHDRIILERLLSKANQAVLQINLLLNKAHKTMESNDELKLTQLTEMIRTVLLALRYYGDVAKELRRGRQRTMKNVEAFHMRCILGALYSATVEARNLCHMLGFKIKAIVPNKTPKASHAWSHHTITPALAKSSTRRRGPTVLPSAHSTTNLRGVVPPVPLHTGGSRSNTISSSSATTPRSVESFSTMVENSVQSRTNTMRSVLMSDGDDQMNEAIYSKIKYFCELADPTLSQVRSELQFRQANAARAGLSIPTQHYAPLIATCDILVNAITKLHDRVRAYKVTDASRPQKEALRIPPSILTEWFKIVDQITECRRARIDIGTIKHDIKPVHHALKDAARTGLTNGTHSFTSSTSSHMTPLSGAVPLVPATPAGAALGHAVQATVASIPSAGGFSQPEYFTQMPLARTRSTHERFHDRTDTVMQPPPPPPPLAPGYSRR